MVQVLSIGTVWSGPGIQRHWYPGWYPQECVFLGLELGAEKFKRKRFAHSTRDADGKRQPLISAPEAITDSRASQDNGWQGGVSGLLSVEADLRKPQIVNAIAETRKRENATGWGNTLNAAYAAGYLPE